MGVDYLAVAPAVEGITIKSRRNHTCYRIISIPGRISLIDTARLRTQFAMPGIFLRFVKDAESMGRLNIGTYKIRYRYAPSGI